MNFRSPKLNPIQGITLLFLLLVIPVGIYVFQTQTVGEIRSKAAVLKPEDCLSENTIRKLKCKEGEVPTLVKIPLGTMDNIGKIRTTDSCQCRPIVGSGGASTPTPIPKSIADRCNTACTGDAACGEGMVCVQEAGAGKCRNAQCYGITDCWCFKVTSPTPGPACNSACTTDVDCGESLICVKTANNNKCRNPQCYGTEDCLCYSTLVTPTPVVPTPTTPVIPTQLEQYEYVPITSRPRATATPTPTLSSMLLADILSLSPTPSPFPVVEQVAAPSLTIDPFYNAKKQANSMISLSGTANADAELDISIAPDGIMTTVTADSMGNWQYLVPKKLTNGAKQLTVIVRVAAGGQTTKTETFTVVGGFQFPYAAVVFSLFIALGVGGYIFYQKKIVAKNAAPTTDQYVTTTPTTLVPPEATPTEEQPANPQTESPSDHKSEQ